MRRECWHCGMPLQASTSECATCGAHNPIEEQQEFDLLGVYHHEGHEDTELELRRARIQHHLEVVEQIIHEPRREVREMTVNERNSLGDELLVSLRDLHERFKRLRTDPNFIAWMDNRPRWNEKADLLDDLAAAERLLYQLRTLRSMHAWDAD